MNVSKFRPNNWFLKCHNTFKYTSHRPNGNDNSDVNFKRTMNINKLKPQNCSTHMRWIIRMFQTMSMFGRTQIKKKEFISMLIRHTICFWKKNTFTWNEDDCFLDVCVDRHSFMLSDFQWKGKNALLNESLKKEYFRNGVCCFKIVANFTSWCRNENGIQ